MYLKCIKIKQATSLFQFPTMFQRMESFLDTRNQRYGNIQCMMCRKDMRYIQQANLLHRRKELFRVC